MRYLQTDPDAPPSRIAAATGLQRTNLSAVLRGLEGKGLIERHASSEDGRGVTVRPTEHGKSNYALVRQEWARAVSAAAGGDSSDLDPALRLLRDIEDGLTSARPQASGRASHADVVSALRLSFEQGGNHAARKKSTTRRVVIGGLLRGPAVAGRTLALKPVPSANDSV